MLNEKVQQRLRIHEELTIHVLTAFIKEEVQKAGFSRVVFGLSGGIDSALVAYLATHALGRENVHALLMPYKTSSASSLSDAQAVVDDLHIPATTIPISDAVDAYFHTVDAVLGKEASALRRGNRMARERMATLFDFSMELGALVLGTSNKTELLLGYGTQFGDMASALNPIGDLFKGQVRQLARAIGVPISILEKAPSADLWENQTDESELGFSYDIADEILYQLVDLRIAPHDLIARGYDERLVHAIVNRVVRNQYKRKTPVIAKLSTRTVGVDFRYLRDWGL